MFGALAVMVLGLAGAVAKVGTRAEHGVGSPRSRRAAALAAVGAVKVPVVDVRVTRVDIRSLRPRQRSRLGPSTATFASTAEALGGELKIAPLHQTAFSALP